MQKYWIAALFTLMACGKPDPEPPTAATATPPPILAAPAKITAEEKSKIIEKITDRAGGVEIDKFKGVSFWRSRPMTGDIGESNAYFYAVAPHSNDAIYFRVVFNYIGSDWVFFDRIQILADDTKVFDKTFTNDETQRDVAGSKVIESVDFKLDEEKARAFDKIAGAKTAVMRYSGKGQRDIALTTDEKMNFAKMVEMYDDARKIDDLPLIGFERRISEADNLWHATNGISSSQKAANATRAKLKANGIETTVENIANVVWFIRGPTRTGYAAAKADADAISNLGITDFGVSKARNKSQ